MTAFAVTFEIFTTGLERTVTVQARSTDDAIIRARGVDSQVNYGNASLVAVRCLEPLRAVA